MPTLAQVKAAQAAAKAIQDAAATSGTVTAAATSGTVSAPVPPVASVVPSVAAEQVAQTPVELAATAQEAINAAEQAQATETAAHLALESQQAAEISNLTSSIASEKSNESVLKSQLTAQQEQTELSQASVAKYKALMAKAPKVTHTVTNEYGNVMSGKKVTLSDGTTAVSDSEGLVTAPLGVTIVS
jgi:hypothetical protein